MYEKGRKEVLRKLGIVQRYVSIPLLQTSQTDGIRRQTIRVRAIFFADFESEEAKVEQTSVQRAPARRRIFMSFLLVRGLVRLNLSFGVLGCELCGADTGWNFESDTEFLVPDGVESVSFDGARA